MKKRNFTPDKDGFYGVYYPYAEASDRAMILMLGDSSDDYMAKSGARWLHKLHINVLAMSPDKKDYGHHNYPLERFEAAIAWLKKQGNHKIGICGASTTGMLSLIAASYYQDLTLTIALSPSDFVMEGFYQDNKDGMHERPGDGESSVSYQGKPLPYLPYAYRHPEYWKRIEKESKEGGNRIASREMFDESERRHPLKEEEMIKVENSKGKIVLIGAEDDCLWDTCRYIRRIRDRLAQKEHQGDFVYLLYEHGTHFVFPESLLKMMLPIGSRFFVGFMFKAGKDYPEECRNTRIDIDQKLKEIINEW